MKRVLLFCVVTLLLPARSLWGQNHTVPVFDREGNDVMGGPSLGQWCSQLGLHTRVGLTTFGYGSPFTFFLGPVPVTVTGRIQPKTVYSPGDIIVQEGSGILKADYLIGDCLLYMYRTPQGTISFQFSRGVSQAGAQVGADLTPRNITLTAYDQQQKVIGSYYKQITNNQAEDGSAQYLGIAEVDSNGNPVAGIYSITYSFFDVFEISELSATVPNDAACYTPPDTTMVAWYPFDEPAPLKTSSNLASANPGTQSNGPLALAAGKVAGAASFDGKTQYVESPSTIATNFGPGIRPTACAGPAYSGSGTYSTCTGNFSIDAWVQLGGWSGQAGTIVDKRSGGPLQGYRLRLARGKIPFLGSFQLELADGVHSAIYATQQLLVSGGWHHIAVTVNRTSTMGIIWYYDGVVIKSDNPTFILGSLANSSPLRIGTTTANPAFAEWFKGNIDELEIYNRELSTTEVTGIYDAGVHGKCK